ncbi:histone PARylation factor 1-like isoform X2 [Acanthaster planci]|uniref:Histone PARylation factor 1-like isoform X2 n=1 Tax=Acanthaster planci TaxID=133434 RepID=A0A8B7XW74_ACAPL|nr:histone PARylation factor 1-like isoform X2 [Acanthaster planci]
MILESQPDADDGNIGVAKKRKADGADEPQLPGMSGDSDTKTSVEEKVEEKTECNEEDIEKESSQECTDYAQPATPSDLDPREEIKWKFKMEMPEDFYDFWEFCQSLNKKNPKDALKDTLGLQLVGPYDVLAGNLKKTPQSKRSSYCLHWRYYYDPPEFQTIVRGDDETQHHLGYFRDEPKELPVFVAANSAKKSCSISAQGGNIFAAVKLHMDKLCKATKDKAEQSKIQSLQKPLTDWAKKCGHSLDSKSQAMKDREKKVVAKTFHGTGIVVPIDANEVGYRELPETDANLKRIFKKIADSKNEDERNKNFEPLDEIINFVQFANDECDYGEGYELGIDLFMYGSPVLHGTIRNVLPLAYTLLRREEFGKILESHLEDRRKDDLSVT